MNYGNGLLLSFRLGPYGVWPSPRLPVWLHVIRTQESSRGFDRGFNVTGSPEDVAQDYKVTTDSRLFFYLDEKCEYSVNH